MRKYGINVVSLTPFSLGKKGFKKSLDIAEKLGLDGIQALPMRGWHKDNESYEDCRDKVISFEDPWNSGTLGERFRRTISEIKKGYPTFMDVYLFGFNPKPFLKATEKIFGQSKFIDHKLNAYRYMVEIYPQVSNKIGDYTDPNRRLVWDTRHVRDKGMPDWKSLLSELSPESIKMIHFQPKNEKELVEFMNYKENELMKMLQGLALKVSRDCPMILEIKPTIRSMMSFDFLMKRLSFIKGIVSDILM